MTPDARKAFAQATEPAPDAVDRLVARDSLPARLIAAVEHDPSAVERLVARRIRADRARVLEEGGARRANTLKPRTDLWAGLGGAMLAVGLLATLSWTSLSWTGPSWTGPTVQEKTEVQARTPLPAPAPLPVETRAPSVVITDSQRPTSPPLPDPAEVAVNTTIVPVRLDADTPTDRSETVGGVPAALRLRYVGSGTLQLGDLPRIGWEAGTLVVEVLPDRGLGLVVETPEGTSTVLGTGFTVERGPLGTLVSVRHGVVRVVCREMQGIEVRAGESTTCLPLRAPGMLARARALRESGADAEVVLEAVARGIRQASPGEVAVGELVALRLEVLVSSGRYAEAREVATMYLESGETARRAEVQALLDRLGAP